MVAAVCGNVAACLLASIPVPTILPIGAPLADAAVATGAHMVAKVLRAPLIAEPPVFRVISMGSQLGEDPP